MELKVGHTCRAKKPRQVGNTFGGCFNDREIIGLTDTEVQYDTPSMIGNRDYPRTSRENFVKWAARDVTSELPDGQWARWG